MNNTQPLIRSYEAMAWGALFIWWGITELIHGLPDGTGAIGVGLILLGLNLARALRGIPTSIFSTTLGILALVWGGLTLAGSIFRLPFDLPVFAVLLLTLGVLLVAPEVLRLRKE